MPPRGKTERGHRPRWKRNTGRSVALQENHVVTRLDRWPGTGGIPVPSGARALARAPRELVDRLLVDLVDLADRPVPAEVAVDALGRRRAEAPAERDVAEEGQRLLGEGRPLVGPDEEARHALLHHLRKRGHAERDHRFAAGHGLLRRQWEA